MMQCRIQPKATRTLLLTAMIVASQAAFPEPVIDDYSVKKTNDGTISITLRGQGFGDKTQAEPVLWVFGNDIRQNGERIKNPSYQIGKNVGETGPSIWSHVDKNVVYDSLTRYEGLENSYFTSRDGTVRNPRAFGWDDPPYSESIYVSARIKLSGPVHSYRGMAYSALSGDFDFGKTQFDQGENITIQGKNGDTKGTIVGIDEDKKIVTITLNTNKENVENALVTGSRSGASLRLHPDQNYQNPSASKYIRMWSGGRPGLYATMSTNRLITGYRSIDGQSSSRPHNDDGSWDRGYGIPNMASSMDWRLLEIGIDQSGSSASNYIDIDNSNRRYLKNIDMEGMKLEDRSPTISQLGWDAAGGRKDVHVGLHFGEIYFDTTPQRIMLSSESEYTESGNELELQYPTAWSDQKIEFEVRAGSLDQQGDLYIYVFDETSTPNQSGSPICIGCELSAPATTELDVK